MNRWVAVVLTLGLTATACGGNDSSGGGSGGSSGGSGGAGGVGGGSNDPLVLVPPVALEAKLADCPSAFQTAPESGQHSGFDVGGEPRSFYLQLSAAAADRFPGPRPLMVAFNGTGENGKAIYNRAKLQSFVDAGFIVVAPDSAGHGTIWPVWDGMREAKDESLPNKDLEYFDQLVKCIAAHHPVDAKRIYVSGHSAGGIFTNRVLRARSSLVAGGIPASGIFDLTAPSPAPAIDGVAVLVTWGGDNDAYSGSAGGKTVPSVNFVEQAALASQHYEAKAEQVHCRGKNLGHAWLDGANPWMIDYLLAHPKGLAQGSPWKYAAPAASEEFECVEGAATFVNPNAVSCGSTATAKCQTYCQFIGDCAVENATVEPVLGPQLETLGFGGDKHLQCGGCLSKCEADASAGGANDTGVLDCFSAEASGAKCAGGVDGAMPFIDGANKCCKDKTSSKLCTSLCTAINANTVAAALFSSCAAWP
ncbi:MAG: alpha/beta fold hydrolase [Polyangiaceae bacterium]|nr:alpha/beta fold hydrolase [Polyangiaceae bacterium]